MGWRTRHDGPRDDVHCVLDGLDNLGRRHVRHLRGGGAQLNNSSPTQLQQSCSERRLAHLAAPLGKRQVRQTPARSRVSARLRRAGQHRAALEGPITVGGRRRSARVPRRARDRALRQPISDASGLPRSDCQRRTAWSAHTRAPASASASASISLRRPLMRPGACLCPLLRSACASRTARGWDGARSVCRAPSVLGASALYCRTTGLLWRPTACCHHRTR